MKELLSALVHPEKPNDTVPAFPMRDNSRAHSGENCEEMGTTDGVIRDSCPSLHQISATGRITLQRD
jgi:hypothetical protein